MFQREQSCRGELGSRVCEEALSCISSSSPKSVPCDYRCRWGWTNSSSSTGRGHGRWRETHRCCSCLALDRSGRFVVPSSDRCLGIPSVQGFRCMLHPQPPHLPPPQEVVAGRCRGDCRVDSVSSLCCSMVIGRLYFHPSFLCTESLVYRMHLFPST